MTANRPKIVSASIAQSPGDAFLFTIPIALKTDGSSSGQDAAASASRLASTIITSVVRATRRPRRQACHPIHSHTPATITIASLLTKTCAWSSMAIELPATARIAVGRVLGRMHHPAQAAAASAVRLAAPARPAPVVVLGAQAQGGDVSEPSEQDGPMTLM